MRRSAALAVALTMTFAGCGGSGKGGARTSGATSTAPSRRVTRLQVSSPAFGEGAAIPERFTCKGANVSPPLAWSDPPAGTTSLAIVVDDPDAPSGTFLHWVLTGLTPERRSLGEGERPPGITEGDNGAGRPGYTGPCPPPGRPHHYRFSVYALPSPPSRPTPDDIRSAAIAEGTLTATFAR